MIEHPQLMIAPAGTDRVLTVEDAAIIKERIIHAAETGESLVFAFAVNIWQLVDGRWEPLAPNEKTELP